jgi:molybdate transport system permease protein
MSRPRRHLERTPWPVVAVACFAVLFVALPLVGLIQRASWGDFWRDITSPEALDALRLSLLCSVSAAALSVALGFPLAWVLARISFAGKPLVRAVVLLPLVLPPVVGGVALLAAFSRNGLAGGWLYDATADGGWLAWLPGGPIQLTFSPAGVVLAETFVALPFFVLTVEAGLRSTNERYEQVAATLGAGRWLAFRRVTLPLVAPSVVAGAVLAWARALGEFGATITFAGNIAGRTQTLPLAVYLTLATHPETAVALSLVLLAVSLVVLISLRDRWLVRS